MGDFKSLAPITDEYLITRLDRPLVNAKNPHPSDVRIHIHLECVTDNTNRTVAELRHLIDKAGGNLGTSGSVAWMFDRKGLVFVDADRFDEEKVLEVALSAGAEDFGTEDGMHVVSTAVTDFHTVQEALTEGGIGIEQAGLAMIPSTTIPVEGRQAERLLRLVADLEDHDDVMKLYANFEVDDAILEAY